MTPICDVQMGNLVHKDDSSWNITFKFLSFRLKIKLFSFTCSLHFWSFPYINYIACLGEGIEDILLEKIFRIFRFVTLPSKFFKILIRHHKEKQF